MLLSKEWILVVALCAFPVLLFGAAEISGIMRRRRFEAVARRSKARFGDGSATKTGRASFR
jgi:hypothetical protein